MKKYLLIIAALALFGCTTPYQSSSYAENTVQYLRNQGDGSITVRVAASGRNYADALEQAGKFALRQTIFHGITVPGNSLLSKPLVTEVNAEEKYQLFFNSFFSEGGDYSRFVSTQDKRSRSDQLSKEMVSVRTVSTIRILRSDLKDYLLENNIIKP